MLDEMLDELLIYGYKEWLMASAVASVARFTGGADTPQAIRELSKVIIREFVVRGLMRIGDVTRTGFVPWEGTLDEMIERIDRTWRTLPREPTLGDVCWLDATEKGEARAQELVDQLDEPTEIH